MTGHSRRGFTLIELLIVVGIVAILAAVAVPNFLEAQTRSKVARVRADLRTLAGAIEAYAVDFNSHPLNGVLNANGTMENPHRTPAGAAAHKFLHEALTTPVAFVTQLAEDPFVARDTAPLPQWRPVFTRYFYTNLDAFAVLMQPATVPAITEKRTRYGIWILASAGPDLDRLDLARDVPYDPTNGTVSDGDIIRSQYFAAFE